MLGFFNNGIQKEINRGLFRQMARRDQDAFMQYLYDKGYSAQEISKELEVPVSTIYSRINAHRGRGPEPA